MTFGNIRIFKLLGIVLFLSVFSPGLSEAQSAPVKLNTGSDAAFFATVGTNSSGRGIVAWRSIVREGNLLTDNESVKYSTLDSASFQKPKTLGHFKGQIYNIQARTSDKGTTAVSWMVESTLGNLSVYYSYSKPGSHTFSNGVGIRNHSIEPAMDLGNSGGGLVASRCPKPYLTSSCSIQYRKLSANGSPGRTIQIGKLGREARQPSIAVNNRGDTLIGWAELRHRQLGYRAMAAYKPAGGHFRVFALSKSKKASEVQVAINEAGQGFVTWLNTERLGKWQSARALLLSPINRKTTKKTLKRRVMYLKYRHNAYTPHLAMLGSKVFLSWQVQAGKRGTAVHAALSRNGGKSWKKRRVSPGKLHWQARPAIAPSGRLALTWYGRNKRRSGKFGAYFMTGFRGSPQRFNMPRVVRYPAIAPLGSNRFLVAMTVYKEQRKAYVLNNADVYAVIK